MFMSVCVLFNQVFPDHIWEMEAAMYTLRIPYLNASLKNFKEIFWEPTKHIAWICSLNSVHLCSLCALY